MKLPVLSGREVSENQQNILSGFLGFLTETIKALKKIDKGTLLEIIRQSGLKREEFLKLL